MTHPLAGLNRELWIPPNSIISLEVLEQRAWGLAGQLGMKTNVRTWTRLVGSARIRSPDYKGASPAESGNWRSLGRGAYGLESNVFRTSQLPSTDPPQIPSGYYLPAPEPPCCELEELLSSVPVLPAMLRCVEEKGAGTPRREPPSPLPDPKLPKSGARPPGCFAKQEGSCPMFCRWGAVAAQNSFCPG